MAEVLVSALLEKLASIMYQEIRQEVRQVVGVRKEVNKLTSTLRTIRAALVDAEKRQVTEEVVKDWIEKLKDISYDMDDVLDEWSTAILKFQIEGPESTPIPEKVCSYIPFPCFSFNRVVLERRDIAVKIKELNERLDQIADEKDRYNFRSIMYTEEPQRQKTTSFVDVEEVHGRDQDKETIVSNLLQECSQDERSLHIISIVGMGGIGKTTLAQLAYNDDDVKAHFDKRIWICVSDPFDEIRIAKEIIIALDRTDPSALGKDLHEHIHESVKAKKFLLVLDDVWTEDFRKWEPLKHSLKNGAQGSRILVTTRNERVAKMMGTTHMHPLEELSKEICRSLFSHIALFGRSMEDRVKLEQIGRKIADKCKGLPLAAKFLGCLMRFKETEQDWQNVLNSEIWELDEAEQGLFPPLLLSYYDLPSALKRCFSYCAIFPKDHEIETDKLIKLWMAQGYLSSRGSMDMETTGREYFQNLVMRSFFQDFDRDENNGSVKSCKMHDIVHDFALFLTKNECHIMEFYNGEMKKTVSSYRKYENGRHSSAIFVATDTFPISFYHAQNLRTLLVLRGSIPNGPPVDLFHHFKCLRALDLSNQGFEVLPRELGDLMHLRYLNLSCNNFMELPETVCDLCNLQTLDLSHCQSLKELPDGMEKLINLRHLGNLGNLRFLPKGIGRLSSLRTLSVFIVSGCDEREACKIGDLENLNNLQGHLEIRGLENVTDAGEAEKAKLNSRQHLLGLKLDFYAMGAERMMDDVVETLKPHPNLEVLEICFYRGILFPSWMMLLTKLRTLSLFSCDNCAHLPPLGKLPFLQSLKIDGMNSVKKVGVEFLGLSIEDKHDRTTEASVIIAFPKLKQLTFWWMGELEEWEVLDTRRRKAGEEIIIMPCLRSLTIAVCNKLKALPHHLQSMPLKELTIRQCSLLEQRCQEGTGDDWSKISHIPNIRIGDDWSKISHIPNIRIGC